MKEICQMCLGPFEYAFRKGQKDLRPPKFCSAACFKNWLTLQHSPLIGSKAATSYLLHSRADRRSHYEILFEDFMIEYAIPYTYEPWAFLLDCGDNTLPYVPDFQIKNGVFIEVKGAIKGSWMFSDRLKVTKFREQFPDHPLVVVDLPFIRLMRRTM